MFRRNGFFEELMKKGLVYRYQFDKFHQLRGGGQPFSSPTRIIRTRTGQAVEELIQPILKPVYITSEENQDLLSLVHAWKTWLKAQFQFYLLAKKGELPPELAELVRSACTQAEWEFGALSSGYSELLPFIRLDALRTEEGFQVVDINSTRPAGVGDCIALNKTFQLYLQERGSPFPLETAFCQVVKKCLSEWQGNFGKGKNGKLGILIREDDGDWWNFKILEEILGKHLSVTLLHSEDFNGNSENYIGFLRSRIKEGDPLFSEIAQGYPKNHFVISPLYRRFLGNKIWMYLVGAPGSREFFQKALGDEYQTILNCFPETGIIKGKNLHLATETIPLAGLTRKEWLFKEPASSSGRQMRFGLLTGRKSWSALIEEQDFTNWIAQKYVPVREELPVLNKSGEMVFEKLFTKYGIYVLGGKLAGVEVMAHRHPLVHGARNTYFSTVWLEI